MRRFEGVVSNVLREERRVVAVETGVVRVVEVLVVADDALGGVGGAEGIKKEGMHATVDWVDVRFGLKSDEM